MACAGVIASAGAQIQFALFTVGSFTSGKSTIFGYAPASSAGAMNPTSFGIANGQVHAVFFLDDQGSTIRLGLTDTGGGDAAPNSALSFNRLIIDDLVLNRSDASYFDGSGYVQWTFTTSDDAISSNNGNTIFAQLRAD